MTTAVVFPGQGSQVPGAGRAWVDHPSWSVVAEAEQATGEPLAHLLLDAAVEELAATRASQLSVLLGSLVAWRALQPTLAPDQVAAVAGHSLGQITALLAAEVVGLADGIRLATERADATTRAQAQRPGGLVALLGCDEATATAACEAAPGRAWVATVNAPGQISVGGDLDVLDAVAEQALALGARRARRLAVDGAFHTPLMAPAAEALAPTLEATTFAAPRWPVVTNHDATVVSGATGWPERLATHLVAPVRWADSITNLVALGVDTFVEVGPGTTLGGLIRRIAPDATVRSVSTPADLPIGASR